MHKLTDFDMSEYLDNPKAIIEYFSQVIEEEDQDELLRALGYLAKAIGLSFHVGASQPA